MSMPSHLFSTALHEQRLGIMFSVIMVILVYLGSLAMAAQAALGRTSMTWGHDLQSRLTVELPFTNGESSSLRAEKTEKLKTVLEGLPDVDSVVVVADQEKEKLLRSWVSDEELLQTLPLPSLLDVTLHMGARADSAIIQTALIKDFPAAQVYTHAEWMEGLLGFIRVLGWLAALMILLTAATLVAVIVVLCKAIMAVQHDTVELLHYLGASDKEIARLFQAHVRRLAIPSSLLGFLLASFTVVGLAFLLKMMGGLSLVAPLSWITICGVMLSVPVGATLLASFSARLFIVKQLRRMP